MLKAGLTALGLHVPAHLVKKTLTFRLYSLALGFPLHTRGFLKREHLSLARWQADMADERFVNMLIPLFVAARHF